MFVSLYDLLEEALVQKDDLPESAKITMNDVVKYAVDPDIEEVIRFASSEENTFATNTHS